MIDRREFLAGSMLAVCDAAARPSEAFGAGNDVEVVRVTVDATRTLAVIPADFLGLGYEISSVAVDGLLSARNRVYAELVRTLGASGVVRVGGNTSDYASYAAGAPVVSKSKGTVVNEQSLRELGEFLRATGWKLIWGLNLGGGSTGDAVTEAKAVSSAVGGQLLAMEIGNEPDLFSHEKHRGPGYDYDAWIADYRRYKSALRAELPGLRLAGPDVAGKTEWVTRFAADEGHDVVLLTHHYYREGQNPASTIEKLLGVDPKLQPELEVLRKASQSCGVPYRICEVNSFSGGGRPGVSDTMASALWALDYMFRLAANGCAGVNMETGVNQLDFVSSYSPIGDDTQGHYAARPEYYGMLAFAHAGKGKLVASSVDGDSQVAAYATMANKLMLTLINKGSRSTTAQVTIATNSGASRGSVLRLTAPAVDAKLGISFGETEVAPNGAWKAGNEEILQRKHGVLSLVLPASSAAVVELS